MSSASVTSQFFRRVMGHLATGITVVTVEREPPLFYRGQYRGLQP